MNIFIASINGTEAQLTPEESWHCARVLRKRAGEDVRLIDGLGNFYEARLTLVTDKAVHALVLSGPHSAQERPYYFHLAIAPTKQIDRIEWMLEKCVEIGIDEISFFTAKNSERTQLKTERMQKIIEGAVKQSLQARLPRLNEVMSYHQLVASLIGDNKLIAHCSDTEKTGLHHISCRDSKTVILIGPEGDFTTTEIGLALQHGFKPVSLGPNRLRTETAGLYACQTIAILNAR